MDLLFTKYANPFILLNQMLSVNRLSEFVDELIIIENDKKLWELYLAVVSNPIAENVGSFEDFKRKNTQIQKPVDDNELVAAVKNSVGILQNFNPATRG